jgi:hypothetical protein
MTTLALPIENRNNVNYEFSSGYDGERFYIELNYNTRNDTWYCTVKNADLDILLSGIANLTGENGLTFRFALDEVFTFGDILTADSNGTGLDPTWENYGESVSLYYVSAVS